MAVLWRRGGSAGVVEVLTRLRDLEADRVSACAGTDAELEEAAHRRALELTAIIEVTRAATDPAVRALTPRAETELRHALRDLCDLALGGPGVVELGGAVRRLTVAVPLPVQVTVETVPVTPVVAAVAYAVVCEALGNAVGHGRARRAVVTVRRHGRTVQLTVSDDGEGGAQPVIGGGIVMLAARVAALGGLLHLDSPPGSGTHVTVELPYTMSGG